MNDLSIMSLAVSMMSQHEELSNWNVRLSDRMTRSAGICDYGRKTISLSTVILPLWTSKHVEDTILHEIAHALTPGAGHGREWKQMCRQIGAKPQRCYSGDLPAPKAKWTGVCPNGHVTKAQRRSKSSCVKCSPVFDPSFMFNWIDSETSTLTHTLEH